jgi:hypothetical protein
MLMHGLLPWGIGRVATTKRRQRRNSYMPANSLFCGGYNTLQATTEVNNTSTTILVLPAWPARLAQKQPANPLKQKRLCATAS